MSGKSVPGLSLPGKPWELEELWWSRVRQSGRGRAAPARCARSSRAGWRLWRKGASCGVKLCEEPGAAVVRGGTGD